MNPRFTLDVPSFQKLLEAAWVLQIERDRELSETRNGMNVLAVPSDKNELNAAFPVISPASVLETARAFAEAHAPEIDNVDLEVIDPEIVDPEVVDPDIVGPSVVPIPLTAAPIYQRAEVAGALALAADGHCSSLPDPVRFAAADVFEKPARGKNGAAGGQISRRVTLRLMPFRDKYRVSLRLVPFRGQLKDEEHALFTRIASAFGPLSRVTAAYAGPVVVLAIMLAFLSSLLGIHGPTLTAVKAAVAVPKIAVGGSPGLDSLVQAQSSAAPGSEQGRSERPLVEPTIVEPAVAKPAVVEAPALEPPALEPSHLRVTDATASSLVGGLSRYEIQTVRQQAQYGDDVAALTLGMAYEIGRHVPQSCAQAAHWIAVAAEEGNPAAQYNLGLRYISGDGIPTDLDEARKWLRKAAGRGYQKASLTLQTSRL
jgi:Sel1 repeat